jgi:hypothetical protein
MKLDKTIQLNSKYRNKQYIEDTSKKIILYYSDPDKKIRIQQEHLCKFCYYVNTSRIGGSAITTVICANCDVEITFGNTCVDILCDKCAEELNVCKHCGQKMD